MTEASRDLDIAVAKLMGLKEPDDFGVVERHDWQWNKEDEYGTYGCRRCRLNSKDWAKPEDLKPGQCDLTPFLPHFGTMIADAWPVLEKFGLVVIRVEDGWQSGKASGKVHFRRSSEDPRGIDSDLFVDSFVLSRSAFGTTAPLAICRAALAALDRT